MNQVRAAWMRKCFSSCIQHTSAQCPELSITELVCPAAPTICGVLYFKCSLKYLARRKCSTFGQASPLLFAFCLLKRVVEGWCKLFWCQELNWVLSNLKLLFLSSSPLKFQGIRCLIHLQIEIACTDLTIYFKGSHRTQDWYTSLYGEIGNLINQMLLFPLIFHK